MQRFQRYLHSLHKSDVSILDIAYKREAPDVGYMLNCNLAKQAVKGIFFYDSLYALWMAFCVGATVMM